VLALVLIPVNQLVPHSWCAAWLLGSYTVAQGEKAAYFVDMLLALAGCGEPGRRNDLFSVRYALAGLAAFIGSAIGGLLPGFLGRLLGSSTQDTTPYGWSLLLAALLLVPAVLSVDAVQGQRIEPRRHTAPEKVGPPFALILALGLIVMIRWLGRGGPHVFFNVYLDSALNVSVAQIGAMKAISQLLVVPAALVTPSLLARWGGSTVVGLAGVGAGLSLLPLALVPNPLAAGLAFASLAALF